MFKRSKGRWESPKDFYRACVLVTSPQNDRTDVIYLVEEADLGLRFRPTTLGLKLMDFHVPDLSGIEDEWCCLDDRAVKWEPVPVLPLDFFGEIQDLKIIRSDLSSLATNHAI
jgi:hypothetical protein